MIIRCERISKTYCQTGVLDSINLSVEAGQSLAVTGASGSGKSTLLHILSSLDNPDSGSVFLDGSEIGLLNEAQRAKLRGEKLGFVYQFHHLLPEFTALENVAMPLFLRKVDRKEALDKSRDLLEKLKLDHRSGSFPSSMSGGERQRVAVARALVGDPICVIADEPTGNLDRSNATLVFDLLLGQLKDLNSALVLATHDPFLAERCGTQYRLLNGELTNSHG